MEIQFMDQKVKTVKLCSLSLGDTFLEGEMNDVCLYLGRNNSGKHEYVILGEFPELCFAESGNEEVRPVKSKLIVEI